MNKKSYGNSTSDKVISDNDSQILLENSSRIVYDPTTKKCNVVYGEEKTLVQELYTIHKIVKRVLASTKKEFYVKVPLKPTASIELKTSALGANLLLYTKCRIEDFAEWLPLHKINPYAQLYLRHFSGPDEKIIYLALTEQVDELNQRVDAIRKEAATAEFKQKIKSIQKISNDNYKSLHSYLRGLFDHHARLLVLRLDLSYSEEEVHQQYAQIALKYQKNNNPSSVPCSTSDHITAETTPNSADHSPTNRTSGFSIDEIIEHREQFIKHLRKKFKPSIRGYAWKLEHGKLKGYHYHLIIMLDGAQVRQDVTIGEILGEHWRKEITKDRGLYYNCNARKDSYRYCAIGMQSHDTPDLERGLSMVARYMTKPDLYVQLQLPDGRRTLGRGVLPKLVEPKRGRPRKQKTALTATQPFASTSVETSLSSPAEEELTVSLPGDLQVLAPTNLDHNNSELMGPAVTDLPRNRHPAEDQL